jgi:hypothetical protein
VVLPKLVSDGKKSAICRCDASFGTPQAEGRILRLARTHAYADWLDERDARLPAPTEQRVLLVTGSGKTVGRTAASNAERMAAALAPGYGPRPSSPPRAPAALHTPAGRGSPSCKPRGE